MLRELTPAARGSQDAGSRNLVSTFQLSTVLITWYCDIAENVLLTYRSDGILVDKLGI